MKTLNTLLTVALFASAAITAQADNPISNLTYEESSNMFSEVNTQLSTHFSTPEVILSYGDDANKNSVWSTEYEQYVNPADFQQANIASVEDVNRLMGDNPTAAGTSSHEVFIYNELAGEYQLQ